MANSLLTTRAARPARYLRKHTMFLQQRLLKKPIFIHILKCGGTSVEAALGIPKTHDTALIRRRRVGAAAWERAFTFSVVRHPYSKVISHYNFRHRHDETGVRSDRISLNDWIMRAYGEKDPRYHDRPLWFVPCAHWLCDEVGKVLVDHVARLETLDQEWPKIAARIGTDAELPHRNTSRADAQDWSVLSPRAREIIDQVFRPDFEIFGYRVPEMAGA